MLKCWNQTKDEVVWWTNGKFAFGKCNIGIGHYEVFKMATFLQMCHVENFQITNNPKFGYLVF